MSLDFTDAPTLPSLSDPETFNDRALNLFSWLTGDFIPELEAITADDLSPFADGTAAAPSLRFANDTDTGLFRSGANALGVAAGGSQVALFTSTGLNNAVIGATTPAAASVTKLNVLNAGATAAEFYNSSAPLTATSAAVIRSPVASGLSSSPVYGFSFQSSTGISNPAANEIGFVFAGSEEIRFSATRFGFGTTSPGARLEAEGAADVTTLSGFATNSSFTKSTFLTRASRAASSAYKFWEAYSGNFGDLEFRFSGDGNATADGSFTGGGADYAEFFEWADGNPNNEDRVGCAVVLDGDKIALASPGETPIGVISGNPSVVGDGDADRWKGKYLRDDFGRYIFEDYEVVAWTEGDKQQSYAVDEVPDDVTVPDGAEYATQQRRTLNPDYDPSAAYVSRAERPEWSIVGLMGKLRVRKDQPVAPWWIKMRDVSEGVEEWLIK